MKFYFVVEKWLVDLEDILLDYRRLMGFLFLIWPLLPSSNWEHPIFGFQEKDVVTCELTYRKISNILMPRYFLSDRESCL